MSVAILNRVGQLSALVIVICFTWASACSVQQKVFQIALFVIVCSIV